MVTTEGTTFVATDVTAQALTVEAPGELGGLVAVVVWMLVHPPTTPRRPARPLLSPTAATGARIADALIQSLPYTSGSGYQATRNSVQMMTNAMENGSISAITSGNGGHR
jgi:hypothetical protein